MKIRITAEDFYGANGERIPAGTEIDITSGDIPADWMSKVEVLHGDLGADAVAITNPAKFEARETGAGWWTIFDADGAEVGKKLRKDDAEAFNGLSDEEKAEFLKAED